MLCLFEKEEGELCFDFVVVVGWDVGGGGGGGGSCLGSGGGDKLSPLLDEDVDGHKTIAESFKKIKGIFEGGTFPWIPKGQKYVKYNSKPRGNLSFSSFSIREC